LIEGGWANQEGKPFENRTEPKVPERKNCTRMARESATAARHLDAQKTPSSLKETSDKKKGLYLNRRKTWVICRVGGGTLNIRRVRVLIFKSSALTGNKHPKSV